MESSSWLEASYTHHLFSKRMREKIEERDKKASLRTESGKVQQNKQTVHPKTVTLIINRLQQSAFSLFQGFK